MKLQKIKTYVFPKGFTLIELIVVITILAILGTMGFISIGGYSSKARDSARIGDAAQIAKSLDLSIVTAGDYPAPDNAFSVTYSGGVVWNQGTIGATVMQVFKSSISWGGLNEKPIDPLTNKEYVYSELAEGKAYQIKVDYEGDIAQTAMGTSLINEATAAPGSPTIAYIRGNYGGLTAKVSTGGILYVLAIPSIITNTGTTTGGSLTTNFLSGTLLFNGKPLRSASGFNPSTLVHSGAKNASNPSGLPDTSTGILNMMSILKSTYAISDIQSNQNIANLINTATGNLTTLGTSMINAQLGGSAVSTGGGGGTNTTVSGTCSGLPSNAVYFNNTTSYSLVSASAGTTLNSVIAGYSANPVMNTCQYKCNSANGYWWNGSSCVITPTCYNATLYSASNTMTEFLPTFPTSKWICIKYWTAAIAFWLNSQLPSGTNADYSSYFDTIKTRFTSDWTNWITPTVRGYWFNEWGGDDYMFNAASGEHGTYKASGWIWWWYDTSCGNGENSNIYYAWTRYCGGGAGWTYHYGVRY